MMTIDRRALLEESWTAVLSNGPEAAEAFYERLMELDPQLGRLFRGTDMHQQGRRLTRAITTLVKCDGALEGGLSEHDVWENPHLTSVVSALFAMLERGMGACLTASIRAAWMRFFACHAADLRDAALGEAGTSRVVPLQRHRSPSLHG